MNRLPVHQPPPAALVAELVRAGVSSSTALAMESWKAREVLELLRVSGRRELGCEPAAPVRGTI